MKKEKIEQKNKKKNGRPKKFSKETLVKAILDTGGIKSEICSKLKCSRSTFNKYLEEDEEVRELYEEEVEKVLDMAEGTLFKLIQNGDAGAIFYYLNNKWKKRGYGIIKKKDDALPDNDTGEQPISGVLVTPGMLADDEWEAAAAKTSK